jgi:hypothetical protein
METVRPLLRVFAFGTPTQRRMAWTFVGLAVLLVAGAVLVSQS